MHVAIDITSILRERYTDVGAYTYGLVRTLVRDTSIQWYLYYYHTEERESVCEDMRDDLIIGTHVHIVTCSIPRAVVYMASMFGIFSIDTYVVQRARIEKLDWLYTSDMFSISPSSDIRFLLGIYDLCGTVKLQWYSFFKRIQHYCIRRFFVRAHNACMIIVPSQSVKQDVIRQYHVNEQRIRVVAPGTPTILAKLSDRDWEDFVAKFELGKQFFVTCVRVDKKYTINSVAKAYERSGLYKRGFSLVIIGQEKRKFLRTTHVFKKIPGVVYVEHLSESEKNSLLSRACVAIYPSRHDPSGISLLRAYVHGVPTIISDQGVLPVLAGGASYMVRPHMISDIVYAMREYAFDRALQEWYGESGKVRATLFDWQQSSQEVLNIFHTSYYSSSE